VGVPDHPLPGKKIFKKYVDVFELQQSWVVSEFMRSTLDTHLCFALTFAALVGFATFVGFAALVGFATFVCTTTFALLKSREILKVRWA
jgi:hypothetical protein